MTKITKIAAMVMLGASILLWACFQSLGDQLLHIYYLNIGQGDAALIRTPTMQHILIDGGPDDKVLEELAAVMPFYIRTIDLIILSHPHADHLNGLIEVLERYEVRQVMLTGVPYGYAGYDRFLEHLLERNIPISFATGRVDYQLGPVVLDILYPFESLQGSHVENVNNSSITLRLLYGKRRFYFSGDLEREGEEKLVKSSLNVGADVLKVGHHGSRTSSTTTLLDKIQPEWAIISCGVDNRFGHPHPETVRALQNRHITLYRTDVDGRIEIVTNGEALWARSEI